MKLMNAQILDVIPRRNIRKQVKIISILMASLINFR